MDYLTQKELIDWIKEDKPETRYCPHCFHSLTKTEEGIEYCPNEMCLYDTMEDDE